MKEWRSSLAGIRILMVYLRRYGCDCLYECSAAERHPGSGGCKIIGFDGMDVTRMVYPQADCSSAECTIIGRALCKYPSGFGGGEERCASQTDFRCGNAAWRNNSLRNKLVLRIT